MLLVFKQCRLPQPPISASLLKRRRLSPPPSKKFKGRVKGNANGPRFCSSCKSVARDKASIAATPSSIKRSWRKFPWHQVRAAINLAMKHLYWNALQAHSALAAFGCSAFTSVHHDCYLSTHVFLGSFLVDVESCVQHFWKYQAITSTTLRPKRPYAFCTPTFPHSSLRCPLAWGENTTSAISRDAESKDRGAAAAGAAVPLASWTSWGAFSNCTPPAAADSVRLPCRCGWVRWEGLVKESCLKFRQLCTWWMYSFHVNFPCLPGPPEAFHETCT